LRGGEQRADVVGIRGRANNVEQMVSGEAAAGKCELPYRDQGAALKPPIARRVVDRLLEAGGFSTWDNAVASARRSA
jgi:hypothetical protein